MKISKNKLNKSNILIYVLALIIINLAVVDYLILKDTTFGNISTFLSERTQKAERESIFEQINPSSGYELPVVYFDLGPKLVSSGVIDLEKFTSLYQGRGGMSKEESNILTKGSDQKIKITRENSNFLLNFFWALGLSNNTRILTDGQMKQYGDPGNFASTGGWTLSKETSMNYYSKGSLVKLTKAQEDLVEKVASGIFRPCCDNSTAFPDCNHGMALLAVLELLAANNVSEDKMFEAAKYINAYWFPTNYYDLAAYFKEKEGKKFSQIDGKIILGKDYSSATGYMGIKNWLTEKGIIKQPEQQGASCGV